ncbi:MAG: ABC transporter substrate-binding protein [Alphaproteobacteria bacterium]|nr:ABC transporter substrate-binding protein [Alphaproteobacteria bacterium]
MTINRIFVFILIIWSSVTVRAEDGVSAYVDELMQHTLSVLRDDKASLEDKIKKSESLMSQNLDLKWMSKFVLGKYRRSLNPEEIQSFTDLYSKFIIKSYSKITGLYKKEQTLKLVSESPISDNEYIVKTTLNAPGLDPIRVDFAIRKLEDAKYKVFDIIAEGISLINSNQAEFANIISNSGFKGLMKDITSKLSNLNKNNEPTK